MTKPTTPGKTKATYMGLIILGILIGASFGILLPVAQVESYREVFEQRDKYRLEEISRWQQMVADYSVDLAVCNFEKERIENHAK